MTKAPLTVLVAAAAFALSGCGGGGSDANETGGPVDTNNTVYQAANGICASASPEELRANYRTPSAKPKDIADSIAVNLAGGIPRDEEAARQGCLDGLKAQSGG
jgi:hypothetical protein